MLDAKYEKMWFGALLDNKKHLFDVTKIFEKLYKLQKAFTRWPNVIRCKTFIHKFIQKILICV